MQQDFQNLPDIFINQISEEQPIQELPAVKEPSANKRCKAFKAENNRTTKEENKTSATGKIYLIYYH